MTWYDLAPDAVATRLEVNPATGRSSERAAQLLTEHGPNALPAEAQVPPWSRFPGQYRGEIALAVAITLMDLFNRLLGTVPLTAAQFGLALALAVLLLIVWEAGKLVARRRVEA